jgi:hypothetical protein
MEKNALPPPMKSRPATHRYHDPCSPLTEKACPCLYTNWTAFGACQVDCKQFSTRVKLSGQSATCQAQTTSKSQGCTDPPCAVNCTRSGWSAWGDCDKDCGGGKQIRTRAITMPALGAGTCEGNNTETKTCNTQECPQPCIWSSWSAWSDCDKPCGPGVMIRTRTVVKEASGGKDACKPTESSDTKTCNLKVTSEFNSYSYTFRNAPWIAYGTLGCPGEIVLRNAVEVRALE